MPDTAVTVAPKVQQKSIKCYVCSGAGSFGIRHPRPCGACGGTKELTLTEAKCDTCGGSGDGGSSTELCYPCVATGKEYRDKFGKAHEVCYLS